MIRSLAPSFAKYMMAIYNDPNDTRSPKHRAARKAKASAGKLLINEALSGRRSSAVARDKTLNVFFETVDQDGDNELDKNEFVGFLRQFPTSFEFLSRFKVDKMRDVVSEVGSANYGYGSTFVGGG